MEELSTDDLEAYKGLPDSCKKTIQSNNNKLQLYSKKLAISVDEYNAFAKKRNEQVDRIYGEEPKKEEGK